MITDRPTRDKTIGEPKCFCGADADILIIGYGFAPNKGDLCEFHALQLSRILLEDLCEIKGDRHG